MKLIKTTHLGAFISLIFMLGLLAVTFDEAKPSGLWLAVVNLIGISWLITGIILYVYACILVFRNKGVWGMDFISSLLLLALGNLLGAYVIIFLHDRRR